ncbi:hypothetical protein QTG54_004581 [Skeletonema marinoi]|uniref:Uncharacterized protein n=1 Tax=Skeletonema marinoi TaxID=267567 RepID=A0AAD9DGT2_9STRA|nr:hypothetical protein QTG54_004581 [Skeletonema marinoi]
MNCALLKEVVMDFMVEKRSEVLDKVSHDAPGGLLADILAATSRKFNQDGARDDDFNVMRISDLRKEVHGKGLDIDGSRETLMLLSKRRLDFNV